jgi:hypothetical protein
MCHVCRRALFAVLAAALAGCSGANENATAPPGAASDAAADAIFADNSAPAPDASADGAAPEPPVAAPTDASVDATPGDAAVSTADATAQADATPSSDSSVMPPADANLDTPQTGEWLDDAGVCRSNQLPSFRSCQATFQQVVATGAPVGGTVSGWCGNLLVWISYATPSLGCAYDSTGATLVARYFGDDVKTHCGNKSYGVSTPNWPAGCAPKPLDAGPDAT